MDHRRDLAHAQTQAHAVPVDHRRDLAHAQTQAHAHPQTHAVPVDHRRDLARAHAQTRAVRVDHLQAHVLVIVIAMILMLESIVPKIVLRSVNPLTFIGLDHPYQTLVMVD